jgi:hypothetical protein
MVALRMHVVSATATLSRRHFSLAYGKWSFVDRVLKAGMCRVDKLPAIYSFAFHSLRAKLTEIDVTANTFRSSPRV